MGRTRPAIDYAVARKQSLDLELSFFKWSTDGATAERQHRSVRERADRFFRWYFPWNPQAFGADALKLKREHGRWRTELFGVKARTHQSCLALYEPPARREMS